MARTERIEVRVSPEEKAMLERLASEANFSVSDWLRRKVFEEATWSSPLGDRSAPDDPVTAARKREYLAAFEGGAKPVGVRVEAGSVVPRASQGLGKGYFPARPKGGR